MSKLIQEVPNQQLPIVAGNDFSINVVVTELNMETSVYDRYVIDPNMCPKMFLVSSNGKRIDTKCEVEENGSLSAFIPGNYLSKSSYGIEILFTTPDDGRNHRTYAPDLIKIVTTTEAANEGIRTYNTTDPYRFNIKLDADIAFISIGSLPSDYITEADLNETLTSYATNSSVENQLSELWQDANSTFIDGDELSSTLSSYATQTYVSSALEPYATTSYVNSNYYDKSEVDSKDEAVKSYISSNYYGKSETDTILASYINAADYDSSTKHINLKNGSTVISYIDAADFVIDGMVDFAYVDSGYLMIIFNTDAGHEDIAIPISDIFDANNYYNRTDIDNLLSSYVDDLTFVNTLSSYVTQTSLSSNSYVTETYFSSYVEPLDDRVTYLETYGGGGGGGTIPSNVVTSYDATYIYCLTQAQYDSLEQQQQLDPYTFYYITDTTNNYVTQAALSSNSYITQTALSSNSYITQTDLSSNSYITQTSLSSNSYVKSSTLNNTLTSYVKKTELSACSYVDSSTIRHIVKITQTDYDNLSSIDANTLYVII